MDPDGRFFFSLIFGTGISVVFDMAFGALVGGISGALQGDHTWYEGAVIGLLSGAVTGTTGIMQLGLSGAKPFFDIASTSLFSEIVAYSSVIMQAATQTELLGMYPGFRNDEGPWPPFVHHGALGQLLSGVGAPLDLIGNGGFGYLSQAAGALLNLDDLIQHSIQLDNKRFRSPIHRLTEWFMNNNWKWLVPLHILGSAAWGFARL